MTKQICGSQSNRIIISCVVLLLFLSGQSGFAQEPVNKFSDPVIRQIHDLADRRDSLALLPFLRDSNPNYRGEALMCLGSLQSEGIIDSIAPALDSEFNGIRMAAAFALGQTYHPRAVPFIATALEKDTVKLVRGMLFDALGKTGDSSDLRWLAGFEGDYQEAEGQAQGILRFALRGLKSPEGNVRMLNIIKEGTSTVGLIYASYHLGRYTDTTWLSDNVEELEGLYRIERDPVVGSNLIMAIIKARNNEAWPHVQTILKSNADYREKVNTIKSINANVWKDAGKLIYKIAASSDPNLAIAAAEAVGRHANEGNLRVHLKSVNKIQNWRSRALLLAKAMELSIGKEKLQEKITKIIVGQYNESNNLTEKAWLLKSLAANPLKYKFVEEKLKARESIIQTYAMETLTLMASNTAKASGEKLQSDTTNLDIEFLRIFKAAVSSGDIARVSMAASAIRDPRFGFKESISDFGFLEDALGDAQSPDLVEAKNEIISTLAYFTDKKLQGKSAPSFNHPIDWERVVTIPPRQLVGIVTSKGEIVVQVNVNWCPGTVSAFLELAESGFYDNKTIHRVVPNFVVQDGCPRGDGWGGPPFTIRSEFTPAPFMEGTLGMASAGKDTEGSQWYFTHTATPHLDGKYSNFGVVVSGIEIVHQLEVGDIIEKMVIIRE